SDETGSLRSSEGVVEREVARQSPTAGRRTVRSPAVLSLSPASAFSSDARSTRSRCWTQLAQKVHQAHQEVHPAWLSVHEVSCGVEQVCLVCRVVSSAPGREHCEDTCVAYGVAPQDLRQ